MSRIIKHGTVTIAPDGHVTISGFHFDLGDEPDNPSPAVAAMRHAQAVLELEIQKELAYRSSEMVRQAGSMLKRDIQYAVVNLSGKGE